MIVGNGLIANALRAIDEDSLIFFAAGVSDSQCTDPLEFTREADLVKSTLREHSEERFYYFSTCSVYDTQAKQTAYVEHKLEMERLVLDIANSYVIRLPNVVGLKGNSKNLVNFFLNQIKNSSEFTLQVNARRFLLGTDELQKLVGALTSQVESPRIVDLVPPNSTGVREIVEILEKQLGKKAKVTVIDGGSDYLVPGIESRRLAQIAGLDFPQEYAKLLIESLVLHEN